MECQLMLCDGNKMLRKKNIFLIFLFLLPLILSSCGSVDKDDALLTLEQASFEYHKETNITTVSCEVAIQNDTIYNISSFDVDMGVYCKGEHIETEPYQYKHRTKHGESEVLTISFTVTGEIDRVSLIDWTPHYETFWKTYINVIVISIVLVILGVVIWIINLF